jgi:sec-independent protein translocase protein TatA
MMGLDNPLHIAFLLVILLLVFGAKRLPEMGQSLGAGLRGFKDSLSGETQTSQLGAATDVTRFDSVTGNDSDANAHVAEHETERTPVSPVS